VQKLNTASARSQGDRPTDWLKIAVENSGTPATVIQKPCRKGRAFITQRDADFGAPLTEASVL
jgi:hypothetical protein